MQPVFRQNDGRDLKNTIGLEVDSIEPAERDSDLILRPDILLDDVLLHVDRLRGKIVFGDVLPPQGRQRMNQSDGKRRAGSQPGPCRQVAVVMDFEPLIVAPGPTENGAKSTGCLISSTRCTFSIIEYTMRCLCSKKGGRYRQLIWQYLSIEVASTTPPCS